MVHFFSPFLETCGDPRLRIAGGAGRRESGIVHNRVVCAMRIRAKRICPDGTVRPSGLSLPLSIREEGRCRLSLTRRDMRRCM
ncbi:unnamed protein product [Ciceribacter sp. T2.26MG-112.2]|nr:unnamed protein product [Ciceribacter naphthalenivorans]